MGFDKFAEKLKETRKAKGLTQEQMAELGSKLCDSDDSMKILPTSANGWGSYESGRTNPTLEGLAYIARYLGVSSDYLLGLSDEPKPQAKEFEQKTGLSELSVSSIMALCEEGSEMIDCMNTLFESADFIRIMRHMKAARLISQRNTETEEQARADENVYLDLISDGLEADRAWFSSKKQIDMCRWQSLQIMSGLFEKIVKEVKDNGKRNEEN